LIVPRNKRNTKNNNTREAVKSYKLLAKLYKEKKLLKNKYKIEFTNNTCEAVKQFKRINIRYDKLGIKYLNYLGYAVFSMY
jgi:hypothetical protein